MAKKGYTPEQIINKLREAEILLSQGETVAVISKKIGVSAHTYYRWRKEYGGMRIDQARRLKELELENSRLKKLVAQVVQYIELLELSLRWPNLVRIPPAPLRGTIPRTFRNRRRMFSERVFSATFPLFSEKCE
jgi:putative transposase